VREIDLDDAFVWILMCVGALGLLLCVALARASGRGVIANDGEWQCALQTSERTP
jgi:hypothetical protein